MPYRGRIVARKSNIKALFSPTVNEVVIFPRPFYYGYTVDHSTTHLELSEKARQKLKQQYRINRYKRARKKVIDLMKCNITAFSNYPQFLTLTYEKNEQDLDVAFRHFGLFIKELNYYLRFKVRYLATIEFQKRGAIHFHVVFFEIPYKKDMLKLYQQAWDYGDVNIKSIKNPHDPKLAFYLSKYISKFKKEDNRLDGRKSYFASRNIIRPFYEIRARGVDNWILHNDLKCVHNEVLENGLIIKKYAI